MQIISEFGIARVYNHLPDSLSSSLAACSISTCSFTTSEFRRSFGLAQVDLLLLQRKLQQAEVSLFGFRDLSVQNTLDNRFADTILGNMIRMPIVGRRIISVASNWRFSTILIGWVMTNRSDNSGSSGPEAVGGERTGTRAGAVGYDVQILESLRKVIRANDVYSGKLKATYDITVPQLISLLAIAESGSLTATDVARRAHLSTSTVIGIIDRLERKGLVQRVRSQRDRRLIDISATQKGAELAAAAPSPLQENLSQALRELPEMERATIARSLQRIVDLMEVHKLELGAVPLSEHSGESKET